MQVKLLRVLQERTVRPVGSNVEVEVDVRIVAATNRDLEHEVEQRNFREDLYYRLNVIQINVPPLRVRGNDILLLAEHFRALTVQRLGHGPTAIHRETARVLLDYDWPGNVRQLQNCMERAATLCPLDTIFPSDLPDKIRKYVPPSRASEELDLEGVVSLEAMERRYIERVVALAQGNKSEAARLLGLDRRTLYRKLERFGVELRPSDRPLDMS
jgi:DNA-binding NtrC family response regulator